ncbi:PAS domain S-box protein [Isachenkonia alkalipeptolytica]|nr:PAS domain S-box protein [Isachenkonia alkalipeptolytica]
MEGSDYGVWDWDIKTNVFYHSRQYNVIGGYSEDSHPKSYKDWMASIHPADRGRVMTELQKHVDGESSIYTAEYKLRQKDGSYIWVHERAKATERGGDGKALRIVGTQRDVTKERNGQDQLLYQKKSFECLFENSPEAIAYFDKNEYIITVNPAFTKLFGYTYEDVKGRHINEVIDPFKKVEGYLTFAQFEKQDLKFKDTVRYDKYGNPIKVLAKGVPIVINDKMVAGYSIYTDVSFMKHAEEQIKKQKNILESHFNYSPDGIAHIDLNFRVLEINNKFTELFGYTAEEAIGKTIDELITPKNQLQEGIGINDMALRNQKIEIDTVRQDKAGNLIDVCVRGGSTIVDGKIIGYQVIYTDIRNRKEAEEKIRYLSYYDKLTGLYNRAFFEEELKRLDTKRQLPLGIIIGDVNGLKLTNDVFGHLEGDQLLIRTAEILSEACRKEDVLCRWGGDEFAILLPHTDKESVEKIGRRIYNLCEKPSDTPINISISLGYGIKQRATQSIKEIIKQAEEQMYRNKLLEGKSNRSHIIDSLQKSMYERSHETEAHAKRMKDLSHTLGKGLNLDNDKLNELSLLAILHDIGKMAIPDDILGKPGKLTKGEWEKMKRHSEIGYRIAETSPELIHISKYILFHHERWDGTGYPQGLKRMKFHCYPEL